MLDWSAMNELKQRGLVMPLVNLAAECLQRPRGATRTPGAQAVLQGNRFAAWRSEKSPNTSVTVTETEGESYHQGVAPRARWLVVFEVALVKGEAVLAYRIARVTPDTGLQIQTHTIVKDLEGITGSLLE